ncbi:unnamed protein product [Rhizoctonia solani]|uniref:HAM1-like N-terminal domain-containing protein n=2 Tax=Rhizoctonia solani TaxID=456999 RepID=A0A8H3B0Z7_9AGAM|nr:hypothetical protein V565_008910 [Rhizoctonia solani 123E]CAE6445246.1 unnamed protein product [Rhizoctonia solani]
MGSCSSCCGRREPPRGEREPLLPKATDYVPPKSAWDKSADALGALSAGKMPTQRQLDSALSSLLSSDLLTVGNTATGALSAHGQALVLDMRRIVQAVARIGLEKNADDLVQSIIWQYRSMSSAPIQVDANWHNQSKLDINVDAAVGHLDEIPNVDQNEMADDSVALLASFRTLLSLLLTSSGFRLLISDILITTRQILADTASDVAAVAAYVETRAEDVEQTIRPDEHEGNREVTVEDAAKQAEKVEDTVKEDLEKALKEAEMKKHVIQERLAEESPDRVKQTIIERVEAIVQQAQSDPAYKSSLQTIINIGEKYARVTAQTAHSAAAAAQSAVDDSTVEPSASVNPVIETDPHLKKLLQGFCTLLERFAGGHSISPLTDSLKQFVHNLSEDGSSGISELLRDAKKWLNKALETPGWITTHAARKELDQLYDRTKGILDEKPTWRTDLQQASAEASELSDRLKQDAATQELIGAIDSLTTHTRAIGVQSVRNIHTGWRQVRAELWRDAVGWLLPRVLAVLKAVPLPRVELKSETLDAVVDDVTFRAPSFIPDHVRVESWSEVRVQGSDAATEAESGGRDWVVEGDSMMRVHIDGLRITANEIAYFFHLKSALLGYRDNGLLSIDIGHESNVGQGMSLDVALETDLNPSAHAAVVPESDDPPPSFFRVKSATVDVPGLGFTLARTHHWILNALAQPLLGPAVRAGVRMALSQSIVAGLQGLDRKLGEVYAQAKEESSGTRTQTNNTDAEPGLWDWWNAFLKGHSKHPRDTDEESDDEDDEPEAQTETQVTTKGVIRTTRQPATDTQAESETVLAVGVAEQILPGLGGPENGHHVPEIRERAKDAINDVENAAENATSRVAEVEHEAEVAVGDAKGKAARAAERMEERRDMERRKKGWKSKAFDL